MARRDITTARAGTAPKRLARFFALALETHISLPLFAVVLVTGLWVVALRFIDTERVAATQEVREASRELANTYEAQVAGNLAGIDQTLKTLRYMVRLKGAEGALPGMREQGLLPPSLVFQVSIADRDGKVVASSAGKTGADISRQPHFIFHRDTHSDLPFAGRASAHDPNAEPHMHFTRRIDDARGRFAGVAIVQVEPGYFTSAYEHSRQGQQGLLGLVGDDGVIRALRIGDTLTWSGLLRLSPQQAEAAAPVAALPDGVPRYLSVRPLRAFGLSAIVGLAEREQMARFRQERRTYLAAAAGGTAVLGLVVTLVSAWSWQLARARRRVRQAQQTYAAASEASRDAFFVLRTVYQDGEIHDFAIEATNTRAEELTGLPRQRMLGRRLCELVPACRHNGIFDALAQVARDGHVNEAEWQAELDPVRGHWLQRQVVPVDDGVVAIVRDITQRKLAEERIVHMAHHDELTGLPNRNLLRQRLDEAIARAGQDGQPVALAFVDLDGFKLVNDGLGHNAGDELLKVVAARMRACLRRNDLLARFGGDEFVLLLPGAGPDPQALAPLLEKVRQSVTEPVQVAGQQVQVSCSMGVVMYPRDGQDASTLMMNADAAMYRAKEGGRNNFKFYAREMNDGGEEKLVLLDGLRQSLDAILAGGTGGFSLVYQPKIDLRSGRMFGVEALLRWQHPEHGEVPPQRFIALAEESGMIAALGDWALKSACRQNQAWRDAGLPPLTVSVNVSPRQFEEKWLVERVGAALRESGLPPGALELEVTESLIMRDLAQAVGKMRDLKAMGVSLSIDDFGTGYSSLSALKSFPISRLKIDKSFVRELASNPDDQAIAMAVISLGRMLDLRVIAEGVETEEQCAFLRANGCDEIQGYLFSRPVPAAAVPGLLDKLADCRCLAQAA